MSLRHPDVVDRTWKVRPDQAEALKAIADEYQILHSELARALLDYALAAVQSGRLRVEVRPSRYELVRLFDTERNE